MLPAAMGPSLNTAGKAPMQLGLLREFLRYTLCGRLLHLSVEYAGRVTGELRFLRHADVGRGVGWR